MVLAVVLALVAALVLAEVVALVLVEVVALVLVAVVQRCRRCHPGVVVAVGPLGSLDHTVADLEPGESPVQAMSLHPALVLAQMVRVDAQLRQ